MEHLAAQVRVLRNHLPKATAAEEAVIYEVAKTPGLSITEIADRTGMTKGTASRIVDGLCVEFGAGLLDTIADPQGDRRKKLVNLSPKGEGPIAELTHIFRALRA
jgi:DNA-binding MarR family transcriptional regulator